MNKFLSVLGLVIFAVVSVGGQAIPTSKLAWDQAAPALVDAQGYTYKHYDDGSATGVTFTNVTCTGLASPFQCETPFPAFTPGNHNITMTASNAAGESVKTSPFAFTFIVTPSSPGNLHIKQ